MPLHATAGCVRVRGRCAVCYVVDTVDRAGVESIVVTTGARPA
jgi:hypothetical protein